MPLSPSVYPFQFRRLPDASLVAISATGDHAFLQAAELDTLINAPANLSHTKRAELQSKFFMGSAHSRGSLRLLTARIAAKRETVLTGPSLHLIVPTLQCAHTCRYCQVSRSLEDDGHAMSPTDLIAACDTIFESPSPALTVEFQGGDPLLRFDLIRQAVDYLLERNQSEQRRLRFVVASTLHQLTPAMCDFFRQHQVYLSTSIDGPASLHNKNRPTSTRNAYERTVTGIEMARELLGRDAVSALMTTTRDSLSQAEAIVDEYVKLGFGDIFIRRLSSYGFARRNQVKLGYSLKEFQAFYQTALERVLYWNRQGTPLVEVSAAIHLNKILSPFDGGFVDLQSPTGAGLACLLYNYDGFVYPGDEARMLKEMGDSSLRLGRIGESLESLLNSETQRNLIQASLVEFTPGCQSCAYNAYCGPDPVNAQSQFGTPYAPVHFTEHCQNSQWMFDLMFTLLQKGQPEFLDIAHRWAHPRAEGETHA
ncbi:His-Xaa-Ser system radical SAM maturase HxsB [Chromobacterium alkanivorans]|uniref:His-Xaa-Ser system radical SAM maturase HxsB n=1 Tax=Chromobacterium alkanivorans TaxID=1071719 RepID=UPI00216A0BAA|nr:His-Xaa-Ser system radical SAM maturase HxsB [Chromobacterium alkanivorans]MCS3806743.1 His-Xaa-Ser system radical SAM maturase HxsB [Chromobacterium alkanivorans]MCS3821085.1 His-Xaa-Ser system radical SAM maturase HxsB [Chromobacterium alkanivorans]MCS3876003.1 His-Xaa-Ser system radical SAM maturase HxsB [Chromobacterium alkanivorans]